MKRFRAKVRWENIWGDTGEHMLEFEAKDREHAKAYIAGYFAYGLELDCGHKVLDLSQGGVAQA